MANAGLGTGSASVTSLNYVGFEEMKGQGAPELLYNQIFIEPNMPEAAGVGTIAAAGYVPGQQSYLKARRRVWSRVESRGTWNYKDLGESTESGHDVDVARFKDGV